MITYTSGGIWMEIDEWNGKGDVGSENMVFK